MLFLIFSSPIKLYPLCVPAHFKVYILYLEGIGFRRIERLLHVSHVSVINWVRKAASQIRKDEKVKTPIKTDVLELDEMCINFKKTFGSGQR